eukprot:344368-Chlamydomonas_euryale.AAC.1
MSCAARSTPTPRSSAPTGWCSGREVADAIGGGVLPNYTEQLTEELMKVGGGGEERGDGQRRPARGGACCQSYVATFDKSLMKVGGGQ